MFKVFDNRRLSDLICLWHELHGKTLKDAKYRHSRLLNLSQALDNPIIKVMKKDNSNSSYWVFYALDLKIIK